MVNRMVIDPMPEAMTLTPERALAIKRALIRQYADQNSLEITGWEEKAEDGAITYYSVKEQPSA